MNNQRLGHILLKEGLIEPQQLDFCLSVQKNNGHQKLGQLLCHYNFVNEMAIAKAIAAQVGWPVFEGEYTPDETMVDTFGITFLLEHNVFPLKSASETVFVVSCIDDVATTDVISQRLGHQVIFYVGMEGALRGALEDLLRQHRSAGQPKGEPVVMVEHLSEWFEHCLNQAIGQSASDIHIEPSQKVIEVRRRIDGILNFYQALPLKYLPRLVNIIFHKAEVTISDFGHFHDARFLYPYFNRTVDIRVSHIPSVHGSSLVLRLLDKGKAALRLSELGYGPGAWQLIQQGLSKPDGIILVVGPTGCGKTTTLYAMLNHLKSIERKIITIEDPVEIQLPLMTQVQMNEKRGICFGEAVRSFLRHDPDIILIGEIRDQLTAQEALRAAMTGHQVFATLHTNKAFDAILRLHDLGLPLTHMAEYLSMIIAQRLVRKLCSQGGFMGQTVIAEVWPVGEAASELIARGDLAALKKFMKEDGHPTMKEEARRLAAQGVTSLEEVQRVLGEY